MPQNYTKPHDTCAICCQPHGVERGQRLVLSHRLLSRLVYPDKTIKKRVAAIREAGKSPWSCQLCADATCHVCGAPTQRPVSYDILHDDGSATHISIQPPSGCVNPECEQHQDKIG